MPLTVPKGLMRWLAPCLVEGGGLSTSLLNIIPEGIHLPLHLLCAKEVPGTPQEEAEPFSRGKKTGPERVGGRPKVTQQVWHPGTAARPAPGRPHPLPAWQPVLQGWS